MDVYPAAMEWVAYNVPEGGLFSGSNLECSGVRHVITSLDAGPVDIEEADEVHEYAYAAIAQYRRAEGLPFLTRRRDKVWSRTSIGDILGDRTLPVVFSYLEMVDERLVAFLQGDILKRFPRWRVLHCEVNDRLDLNLAVYSDAISAGASPATADVGACLAAWRQRLACYREETFGPLVRQLDFLEARLRSNPPGYWRALAPLVVGAFDNFDGDQSWQAVWFLVRGTSTYLDMIECEGLAEGRTYAVQRSGRIGPLSAWESRTGLWIRQVVLPVRPVQRLKVGRRGGANIAVIEISKFVSDQELVEGYLHGIDARADSVDR